MNQHLGGRLSVEPDYGQFYLRRVGATWASGEITKDGIFQNLWTDGGFVYVGTNRKFGTTPVEVALSASRPSDPDSSWQLVQEVSLDPGGDLDILSWNDPEPVATVRIDPGPVRLRVLWRGIVVGRFEGMDEDGNSDEELRIEIWPEERSGATLIRDVLGMTEPSWHGG